MKKMRSLQKQLGTQLRGATRKAIENARRKAQQSHIAISGRANIVAKVNAGDEGVIAISQQQRPIVQDTQEVTPPSAPRSGT
ncbi:MAG: hypothetical protein U0841_04980 [Chloroflexia bacterium]